ncbi:MAG: hypothetical protein CMI66_13615 [Pedosphaera sp.]|nr:hypothetical protein [Pedosphaera sp.]
MNLRATFIFVNLLSCLSVWSQIEDFPLVPGDMEVRVFAQEPLVRNPCAITFDSKGRLFVGMGPQYRRPKPETEGDKVFVLYDSDQDGVADGRKAFAEGLNNIQGMVWLGDQLWIANSPDLTVVRDLDGDDEADEYLRLYTDLGNIEHGLHGLNWAPDGKLYMSKGNSKGLNQAPDRIAPKAFRELWGMSASEDVPDFPEPRLFTKTTYRNTFHDPNDDWGLNGGVLRCNPDGSGLEIVSRGMRNPWDIAFDSQFNWIGTDNDQNLGDKLFSPFYSANFGWGHPWSYDWLGDDHLPTAPSAGPLFEGSGTGVVFCDIEGYPEHYRGLYLINDWLKREVYLYKPYWKGAWMRPLNESLTTLASAGKGRTMKASSGRRFDPVDIEFGPDKAIYISSWGRQYGASMRDGRMVNEGRIYRLWPKSLDTSATASSERFASFSELSTKQLIKQLASHMQVRRVDAQNALVKQGSQVVPYLKKALEKAEESSAIETWLLWTLGRIGLDDRSLDAFFQEQWQTTFNRRLQSLRIVAFQVKERHSNDFPAYAALGLREENARLRHESVLGLHQSKDSRWNKELVRLLALEDDRLVYYSAWQAMRDLFTASQQKALLKHHQPSVRRAALLSLLEDDALSDPEIQEMTRDADATSAFLAQKRLGGKAAPVIKGPAISLPTEDKASKEPDLQPEDDLSIFALELVRGLEAESGRDYEQASLQQGVTAYTDRPYRLLQIPEQLAGETFIRGANADADAGEGAGMQFELLFPSTVFVADDTRGEKTPDWLSASFTASDMFLQTQDSRHRLYAADVPAGLVKLGSNKEGVQASKSGYIVIIQPQLLQPGIKTTQNQEVLGLVEKGQGDIARGRALFHHPGGVRCSACHRLEQQGNAFAPDLKDISTRADAEMIVRSILEPSAEITEGFVSLTVETKEGEMHEGLIVSESGRVLTLANASGQTVDILRSDIAKRESSKSSAMPGGLGDVLSPLQVADLVAYLKHEGAHGAHQESVVSSLSVSSVDAAANLPSNDQVIRTSAESTRPAALELNFLSDGVDVHLNGQAIARFYHQHPQVHRPFWAHIKTPSGRQVTRRYPPIEGLDSTDHPHMHPGLSLGYAVLNDINFWHNREGRVAHKGYDDVYVNADNAGFSVSQSYLDVEGAEICEEVTHYSFQPNVDGYLLMWDTRYASEDEFYFGVKEEMGLALRVATPLVVKSGSGRILASHGGINESGTWGKVADWWDYAGMVDRHFMGIQLMSGPGNPDIWSHSRDYGVLVANPFPVDIKPNRDHQTIIKRGSSLRLRFGIQIHEHGQVEDFQPERAYQRYLNAMLR